MFNSARVSQHHFNWIARAYLAVGIAQALLMFLWQSTSEPPAGMLLLAFLVQLSLFFAICSRISNGMNNQEFGLMLTIAVLLRGAFVFTPILLTGDIHRYLWEGLLVREGLNPFALAPDDGSLLTLRNQVWSQVEYPHMGAIYPPVAQACFALFGFTYTTWKAFVTIIELGGAYLLYRYLKAKGLSPYLVLIYLLLPLGLFEISLSGHLEGILVALLAALLLVVQRGQSGGTASLPLALSFSAVAAIGFCVKYTFAFPAALALLFISRQRGFRFAAQALLWSSLFTFLMFIPFLDRELSFLNSLQTYLLHWRYNDSALHLFGTLFSVDWGDASSFQWIRLSLLFVWLVVVLALLWQKAPFEALVTYGFALFLLLGPVFHPWYALGFAPLLVVVRSRSLLLLCLVLPLAYYTQLEGIEKVPVLLKTVEFLPAYALLFWELLRFNSSNFLSAQRSNL